MVYNWARGTNVEITWEVAAELAKIDRIIAIKDSTTDEIQALRTLEYGFLVNCSRLKR